MATVTGGIVIAQAAATLFMTGLIWFVQIVHYPLFDRVGRDGFAGYHAAHSARTTWVVLPPMLVEATTAIATAVRPPPGVLAWHAWLGLALVGAIWLSTATLQVPRHRRLALGFDAAAHRALVASDWIRVAAWSARTVLVLSWIA